jgi:hypothetical protein
MHSTLSPSLLIFQSHTLGMNKTTNNTSHICLFGNLIGVIKEGQTPVE